MIKHTVNKNKFKGGALDNEIDFPSGGFPPIYLCSRIQISSEEENKNREYSSHKSAVSIKDILSKRREIIPFISI